MLFYINLIKNKIKIHQYTLSQQKYIHKNLVLSITIIIVMNTKVSPHELRLTNLFGVEPTFSFH